MDVLCHHVYEFKKGLRNLVLHTTRAALREHVEARLERSGVDYEIYAAGRNNINVFFGAPVCVDVIRRIGKRDLGDYTQEEDFLLGIMLGYDRLAQCERYLQRKSRPVQVPQSPSPDDTTVSPLLSPTTTALTTSSLGETQYA